jgi:hypothetical protein
MLLQFTSATQTAGFTPPPVTNQSSEARAVTRAETVEFATVVADGGANQGRPSASQSRNLMSKCMADLKPQFACNAGNFFGNCERVPETISEY